MWWAALLNTILGAFSSGVPPIPPGSYESIASATGTGSSNTITFSSIPSTYVALQIRGIARNTNAGTTSQPIQFNFNGDTSSIYDFHQLNGDGSSATAAATINDTKIRAIGVVPQASAASNIMGAIILDVYDYTVSSRNTTVRIFAGSNSNAADTSYRVTLTSGLWRDSSINSISIVTPVGSWNTQTQFALYGIKG